MLELHKLLTEYRNAKQQKAILNDIPVFDEVAFRNGKYNDGCLLRYRGTVQDVQDPELVYLATEDDENEEEMVQKDVNTMQFAAVNSAKHLMERIPLKVARFTQATDWARKAYEGKKHEQTKTHDPNVKEKTVESTVNANTSIAGKRVKRSSDDVDIKATHESDDIDTRNKKTKADATSSEPKSETNGFLPPVVNIYVYDGQYTGIGLDAFKVNESFEFIGVLDLMVLGSGRANSVDTNNDLTAHELEALAISDVFESMQQRDRSGVVLHCCDVLRLENLHHVKPHRSVEFYDKLNESNASRTQFCLDEWKRLGQESASLISIRQRLIEYLAEHLVGDILAAEYLLLSLLSRVYARADPSTPLGNLSLNFMLSKAVAADDIQAFASHLEAVIRSIVPLVASVDLSLHNLNETKFIPHKDYQQEVLFGGKLQVPHGTALIVNETFLSAGQLNDQGVKNIGALQTLVEKMLLPYDFQYYSMDFPQDVTIVTISEGKSILPVTVSLSLICPNSDQVSTTPSEVSAELLECFRVYIGVLRSLAISIDNEQAEIAEKHYVECRKAKQEVSLDDLHRWLRLARLLAVSRGEDRVSTTTWNDMLALEAKRLEQSKA